MKSRIPEGRIPLARTAAVLILGVLLLWVLVHHAGGAAVRDALRAADRRLLAIALLLFLSQNLTVGLRWWLALRLCGLPGRFVSTLRASSMANLVNFLAPGHFGEPAASAWLGATGRAPGVEAFGMLVAAKTIATVLNLVALLACLPLLAGGSPRGVMAEALLLAASASVFAGSVFAAVLHPAVAAWGIRVAVAATMAIAGRFDRPRPGQVPRSERAARRVESLFGRFRNSFVLLARSPGAMAAITAVAVVKVVCLIASLAAVYAALGWPLAPMQATFVMSVDGIANLASDWIPGNLGLQEVVHASAASGGLGMPETVAVSAALVVKAEMVALALLCGVLWLALAPLDPARRVPGPR